jgi:hypothetical protein
MNEKLIVTTWNLGRIKQFALKHRKTMETYSGMVFELDCPTDC